MKDPVYHVTCVVSQQHDSQLSVCSQNKDVIVSFNKPPATQHKVCVWQMGFKLKDVQVYTGSNMDSFLYLCAGLNL